MAKENTSKKGEAKGSPDQEGSKFTLSKIIENDRAATVLSIILAVIVWAFVTASQFPNVTKDFKNVKVEVRMEGSSAEAANLQILKIDHATVNVTLEGTRTQIGDLKSEDLTAVISADGVSRPGISKLPYTIESVNGIQYSIKDADYRIVDVEFDKIIEKEIPVRVKEENIVLKDGYFKDDAYAYPDTITIKGSSKLLDSITEAEAAVTWDSELDETIIVPASKVSLLSNGAKKEYNQGDITFSKTIEVTIPVYARKTLPLDVSILNAPANLDVDYFKEQLKFSVNSIDVAAPNLKDLNERKSINLGTIDMYLVNSDTKKFERKVEEYLPEGYRDLSNLGTVTITLPDDIFASKTVMMTKENIKYINQDPDYAYEPLTSGMGIRVVGDTDQISQFTAADLTAVVNLEGSEPNEAISTTVDITINSKFDKIWIYNDSGKVKPTIYTKVTKFETNIEETPVE